MVTACYIVIYYVTDYPMGEEPVRHEDAYRNYDNALLVAKDLAKCLDVVDDVYVIDGLTGEVINTILKDAPQEDKAEEDNAPADNTEKNNAPTPVDTYKDKNGDTWFRISDGRWRFYCVNRYCADCPYYDKEYGCIVREALQEADRNYQVDLARERMLAKTKETEKDISASTDIFNDGMGGVWRLTEDDKWDYNCTGLVCTNCVYCDDGRNCLVLGPVTREERDIQIESAKARMKK